MKTKPQSCIEPFTALRDLFMCTLFGLVVGTVADRLSLRQSAGSDHWPEALHLMKNMVEAQVP